MQSASIESNLNNTNHTHYLYDIYSLKESKSKINNFANIDLMSFIVDTHFKMYNEKFIIKQFHVDLVETLTRAANRNLKDNAYILIINMPFRYSKTQIMSYYVMWNFLKNQYSKFIYTTYSKKLTLRTSREIKKGLINIYKQQASFSKESSELWETNAGGGFWATTMQGAVTGFGAGDIYATPYSGDLIIDDSIKIADSFYETKRENVIDSFSNTFWSRRNQLDKIPIILIEHRTSVNDLSGWIMNKSGYKYERFCLKGIDDNGEATFPERVSKETLLTLKESTPYAYHAQVQQEPQAYTGNYFLVDKTQIISAEEWRSKEVWMKYFIRSWDFAGVKKETKPSEKNDYTRGILMCTDGNYVYILDLKSHHGTVDKNDSLLVSTANDDGWRVAITVPEDPGSAGQHYVDYLQNLKELGGYSLHAVRPTHNKQLRAAPFASFLNQGKVVIVSDDEDTSKWNHLLLEELAAFPFGSHDDIIDAASDAFHMIHTVNKFI